MTIRITAVAILVYLIFLSLSPSAVTHAADGVAPPAADETLIYVIREKRFTGGAVGYWIGVNDQTVARVRHKKHAIVRAKAGLISVNLAMQGVVIAAIAVDDRPGEIVYLKYRLGDENIVEVGESEAMDLLKKSKLMDPIDEIVPNNEELKVLMNLSRLGFDVMRPSSERLEPDANSAVITLFRRREKVPMEFGIWTDSGFVGTLADNQALELRVPAGQHLFSATLNNTTVISAAVEAGKRYHAWLDVGKMMGRLRLTPVTLNEQKNLDKWLADVDWVEMNSDLLTPRATQREEIIVQHLRSLTEKLATGEVEFSTLGSDHAY